MIVDILFLCVIVAISILIYIIWSKDTVDYREILNFLPGSSTDSLDKTSEDSSKGDTPTVSGAQCEIEGEDIFNGYVFSKTGSPIKKATKIDCDNCNKYVNKINLQCINYIYDKSENESSGDKSDWPGNKKKSDANPNEGVCTGSIKPTGTKCPF
jgi:hypothetical protein